MRENMKKKCFFLVSVFVAGTVFYKWIELKILKHLMEIDGKERTRRFSAWK